MKHPLTLVGGGRLGRSLHALLTEAGWDVTVVGRALTDDWAPIVLLTVPDAAVSTVAAAVPAGVTVLHSAGSLGLDALGPHAGTGGSFHPLMTFPGPERGLPDLAGVPAALAGSAAALDAGRKLAYALGMVPLTVPGDRRLYHAAAVMAGNFATVLLADAAALLAAAGVPRHEAGRALLPLAQASLQSAASDPAASLTGPVARGDEKTIEAHIAAMQGAGLDGSLELYQALTHRARQLLCNPHEMD